uniref:Uncharacterized protein n=1 Tax=Cajanus cajan TaxID=3821 RepID=A0A151RFD8_CAJCA|nr:hypothetical protein KK1_037440 [Cajanus cajan]
MPNYAKFLKEIISNKKKLEEFEMVELNEKCFFLIKLSHKLKDLRVYNSLYHGQFIF